MAVPVGVLDYMAETRDRLDLRIEPDLHARLLAICQRLGINKSAYIRLAVVERLTRDERDYPPAGKRAR